VSVVRDATTEEEAADTDVAATSPEADDEDEDEAPADVPLVFKGSTREYFRLWIVNLCLTLFTFGIFSAWAKVRKKRYFYSNTELSGTPFEYLGNPLPILKGRLVAAALLALWYLAAHLSLKLLGVVAGVVVVLMPWALVRTAAFNTRYSAYRNVSFRFSGTYFGAVRALLGAGLLGAFTCGLGYPWAYCRVRRYFVESTSFGGVCASYKAHGAHWLAPFALFAASVVAAGALFVAWARSGPVPPRVGPALVISYAIYLLGYVYLSARVACINWRYTTLGPLSFRADYRARDFVWLYLTNALAIVGSLGLLVPWAAVRMYRYRLERLSVTCTGSLDAFRGEQLGSVRATGAEVADLFDFDLSL